ncbi:MAG: DUF3857 domain-containing protein, partial [Bacteroidota bacterium]
MHRIPLLLIMVILTSMISLPAASQTTEKAIEIKNKMWNKSDADFAVTEIPDKWKDKSAVIIARHFERSYYKQPIMAFINYYSHRHERVKILSKSALDDYSEFTVPTNTTLGGDIFKFYAGFKLIKPDGTEREIPLSDGVKEERKVNNFTFDNIKLAIPNLEVGDIIDYYIAEERTMVITGGYHSFDPFIFQLSSKYPISYQKISFDISRRCFLNIKSLNGAPEFKKVQEEEKDFYTLIDRDREDVDDLRWFYENRQLPTIKYKVTYASPGIERANILFLGQQREKKTSVTTQEIKNLSKQLSTGYLPAFIKAFRKKHKGETDRIKIAQDLFYTLRNDYRIEKTALVASSGEAQNQTVRDSWFTFTMSRCLKYLDISHEVLIGIPRTISDLDDLILENELVFMIKITQDKDYYLGAFDNYATFGSFSYLMEGTRVYRANGLITPSLWQLKQTEIPVSSFDDNLSVTKTSLSLNTADAELTSSIT